MQAKVRDTFQLISLYKLGYIGLYAPIIKMDIWTFTLFYGELCLNSYISSISFLPHASFEIYELLLPFNLFKCKNVLILLLLKVYEKYDYNSSICTSNDNKLAVTSFKIWLFHKLVPNLLHICYQISWTMQRVKCTFS